MRTTVAIDDDVLEAARALARAEGRSIGQVLSELARRGLRPAVPGPDGGFPTFPVPPEAAPLTADDVARALDEGR